MFQFNFYLIQFVRWFLYIIMGYIEVSYLDDNVFRHLYLFQIHDVDLILCPQGLTAGLIHPRKTVVLFVFRN